MDSAVGEAEAAPRPLRIFFIPFFATGHLIPMVNIAHLFASRGVDSTLLVTLANATLIRKTVDRAAASGLPICTLLYLFPTAEAGLPPGAENLTSVSLTDSHKIVAAIPYARPAQENLLRLHHPDAIISDTHFPGIVAVARDLGVPIISFHAIGLFPDCVMNSLFHNRPHLAISDVSQPFLVPGLPHSIHTVLSELPDFIRCETILAAALDSVVEAEAGTFGVIVNSFSEIESVYADHYYKVCGRRSWFVGPVALATYSDEERAAPDGEEDGNRGLIMTWLNSKSPGSVVYVCFGSWCHFSNEQIKEMALGLEACGHPFLWVVREGGQLPEGFEERVEGRGLVVKGWAPQVAVLSHAAVGGFVTHCGWNSVMEGVSAGVPMVTWPLSADQFINEKLVVEVLGMGVKNWDGFRSTVEDEVVVVKAEDIEKAVGRIMGGGKEAEGMRRRVRDYGGMARAGVIEGGSSYNGLSRLIEEIRAWPTGEDEKDALPM